jgi:CDP-diacylglycerol--serine O-phosphatidyltransferase
MKNSTSFKNDAIRRKGIYVLPNLFTTASLFCGFYSIIASTKSLFEMAAIAILIAAVFDGLDGRIARMTNTTSKFGGEYDSLSDVVAFGVAPAMLAAFLFVACGALRLARYNVQVGLIESKVFNGLPIPAAAVAAATWVLLFYYLGGEGKFTNPVILLGLVGLSILMVSNIKYYSFKDLNFFTRKPFMSFVLIVLILTMVVAEFQIMTFTFAMGYSLSGPVWTLYKVSAKVYEDAKTARVSRLSGK